MRLSLAAAFLFVATPAFAGPASDAVMFFYSEPLNTAFDQEFRDRFIDPALAKFKEHDQAIKNGNEIGCIDFALQIDAQDYDDAELKKTLKLAEEVNGDDAMVTASFHLFPGDSESEREIVWELKRVGGTWKIADIGQANGAWRLSDLECE